MNVNEVGENFNCDCGFSWRRGQSGSHSCGDGLRKQIAELKAQRDALAAENAAQKEYLKECSVVQGEGNWNSAAEKSVYVPAIDWMPPTPATAAYLNSVRADAVASFAHHQRVISDSETDPTIQRGHRITACRAEDFAAQLRAGETS